MSIYECLTDGSPETKNILLNYKTELCKISIFHKNKLDFENCPFYHNQADRRRYLFNKSNNLTYTEILCPEQINCNQGKYDDCGLSHNAYEVYFHLFKYKIEKCGKGLRCNKNVVLLCPFVHSNEFSRLNIIKPFLSFQELYLRENQGNSEEKFANKYNNEIFDINLFKTKLCCLNSPHNLKQCFYFHCESDSRRSPIQIYYSSEICSRQCVKKFCRFSKNAVI